MGGQRQEGEVRSERNFASEAFTLGYLSTPQPWELLPLHTVDVLLQLLFYLFKFHVILSCVINCFSYEPEHWRTVSSGWMGTTLSSFRFRHSAFRVVAPGKKEFISS